VLAACGALGAGRRERPAAVLHTGLLALPAYRTSALFNDPDRLVLDYAVGMNCTPVEVPDELFAQFAQALRRSPASGTHARDRAGEHAGA